MLMRFFFKIIQSPQIRHNIKERENRSLDIASPIIVSAEHFGNFYAGQFFFDKPDIDYFTRQADDCNIVQMPSSATASVLTVQKNSILIYFRTLQPNDVPLAECPEAATITC